MGGAAAGEHQAEQHTHAQKHTEPPHKKKRLLRTDGAMVIGIDIHTGDCEVTFLNSITKWVCFTKGQINTHVFRVLLGGEKQVGNPGPLNGIGSAGGQGQAFKGGQVLW